MGFDCALRHLFSFIYRAELDNDLIENEYDHVFTGKFDGVPSPDESEVLDWKWVPVLQMVEDIRLHPSKYTYWVKKLSVHLADILKAQA
jgi:isopentenyl-diphosphate delta-isomerase